MRKKRCGKWIPRVKKEVVDSTACRCTRFHESMKSTEIIPLTVLTSLRRQMRGVMWNEISKKTVLLFLISSDAILPVFIKTHQQFISMYLLYMCTGTIISLVVWMFLLLFLPWLTFILVLQDALPPPFNSKKRSFVCSRVSAECEAEWLLWYHFTASVNCWYRAKLNRIQKVCSECPTFTLHTAASNRAKRGGEGVGGHESYNSSVHFPSPGS